ncbi:MAG: LysR family transcriptional regulator [Candidatus Pelagadaptatus aseana]|uniref:LysR family transcriptional regulator n=1 Tax=Candidatus Pelagadaptatus aseana TaxID=3120508 RepID=UPI0039B2F443
MDLRKLSIFREVAVANSFRKAAEKLHIAQPAVSIAVKKLEDELGTPLFNRIGRGIEITREGSEVLRRAETILAEVNALKSSVTATGQLLRGQLCISSPAMLATYFLPDLLSEFLQTYPGLTAAVSQLGTREISQQLLDRKIELGVITLEDTYDHSALEIVPLISEELVVCVRPDSHLSQCSSLHIKDLQDEPLALYETGYFIRNRIDQMCRSQNIELDVRLQTNFLPLLIRSVKQGIGSTIALKQLADQEPEINGVPLKPQIKLNLALAKLKNHTITQANQAFFDWLANRHG